MKSKIKKNYAVSALMAVLCILLFSFHDGKGGEGFEIYLNNKLVLQQFGKQMDAVKTIQLDNRFSKDQLTVKYHHCGRVGKGRTITIKDGQNKILKEWRFIDVSDAYAAMNCDVKEILGLQKGNSRLNLYYSSTELPKGRLLASITGGTGNNTATITFP